MGKQLAKINRFYEDIIYQYIDNIKKDIPQIKQAIELSDFEKIESISHKLVGTAGSYGLNHLGTIAQELESTSKERKDIEKIKANTEKMEDYVNNLEIEFIDP